MRRKLIGAGMVLLLILSLYPLIQHKPAYWLMSPSDSDPAQADFIVYHSVTHHYSDKGQLKDTLFSEKMEFFKARQITRVMRPYLLGYHDKDLAWRIMADQGERWEQENKIVLRGHVVLYQLPSTQQPETTITTDYLTYYPNQGIATTDAAVLIRQPSSRFSAVGMTYNLKTGTLVAHAQSRGHYALR